MKKLLALLFLLPALALAEPNGQLYGFLLQSHSSSSTAVELGNANTYAGWSLTPPASKTISELRFYVDYKAGTPVNGDARFDIWSHASDAPSASLSNTTTNSGAITGAGWYSATGLSQAVTGSTPYWAILRNVNGTPGTNLWAIRMFYHIPSMACNYDATGYGDYSFKRSTDAGTSWNNSQRSCAGGFRIKFTDNTYYGVPIQQIVRPNDAVAGDRVYAAREVGNKFTTPANASLKAKGIVCTVNKTSTPTGNLRYRLYTGTTLTATTDAVAPGALGSARPIPLYFSSTQTLTANTSYRAVIAEETNSDASTVGYNTHKVTWDSDANSLPLKPFNGTLSGTICTSSCSGGSWTDDANSFYSCALLLDTAGEFASSGSGEGRSEQTNTGLGGM